MTSENKKSRLRVITNKTLSNILLPDELEDLPKYCRQEETIIAHCYGYFKDYCPKTCNYARSMN